MESGPRGKVAASSANSGANVVAKTRGVGKWLINQVRSASSSTAVQPVASDRSISNIPSEPGRATSNDRDSSSIPVSYGSDPTMHLLRPVMSRGDSGSTTPTTFTEPTSRSGMAATKSGARKSIAEKAKGVRKWFAQTLGEKGDVASPEPSTSFSGIMGPTSSSSLSKGGPFTSEVLSNSSSLVTGSNSSVMNGVPVIATGSVSTSGSNLPGQLGLIAIDGRALVAASTNLRDAEVKWNSRSDEAFRTPEASEFSSKVSNDSEAVKLMTDIKERIQCRLHCDADLATELYREVQLCCRVMPLIAWTALKPTIEALTQDVARLRHVEDILRNEVARHCAEEEVTAERRRPLAAKRVGDIASEIFKKFELQFVECTSQRPHPLYERRSKDAAQRLEEDAKNASAELIETCKSWAEELDAAVLSECVGACSPDVAESMATVLLQERLRTCRLEKDAFSNYSFALCRTVDRFRESIEHCISGRKCHKKEMKEMDKYLQQVAADSKRLLLGVHRLVQSHVSSIAPFREKARAIREKNGRDSEYWQDDLKADVVTSTHMCPAPLSKETEPSAPRRNRSRPGTREGEKPQGYELEPCEPKRDRSRPATLDGEKRQLQDGEQSQAEDDEKPQEHEQEPDKAAGEYKSRPSLPNAKEAPTNPSFLVACQTVSRRRRSSTIGEVPSCVASSLPGSPSRAMVEESPAGKLKRRFTLETAQLSELSDLCSNVSGDSGVSEEHHAASWSLSPNFRKAKQKSSEITRLRRHAERIPSDLTNVLQHVEEEESSRNKKKRHHSRRVSAESQHDGSHDGHHDGHHDSRKQHSHHVSRDRDSKHKRTTPLHRHQSDDISPPEVVVNRPGLKPGDVAPNKVSGGRYHTSSSADELSAPQEDEMSEPGHGRTESGLMNPKPHRKNHAAMAALAEKSYMLPKPRMSSAPMARQNSP